MKTACTASFRMSSSKLGAQLVGTWWVPSGEGECGDEKPAPTLGRNDAGTASRMPALL